jgi:Tfp pilus assembly protein FimT
MVSTTILAILTAIVIPNFTSFIVKVRVDNEISQLHRLLMVARNSAISYGQNVTVCPLAEDQTCTDNWQGDLTVFIDANNDQIFSLNTNDKLIRLKMAIKDNDKLQYGIRRNRIIFSPTGRTTGWGSNGTFKYCPETYNEYSRAIVIAMSGRFYLSTDANNDGLEETRNGANINCR